MMALVIISYAGYTPFTVGYVGLRRIGLWDGGIYPMINPDTTVRTVMGKTFRRIFVDSCSHYPDFSKFGDMHIITDKGLAVEDFNLDGRKDIAYSCLAVTAYSDTPDIYHSYVRIRFQNPLRQFNTYIGRDSVAFYGIISGDFNGNGQPDIVAAIPSQWLPFQTLFSGLVFVYDVAFSPTWVIIPDTGVDSAGFRNHLTVVNNGGLQIGITDEDYGTGSVSIFDLSTMSYTHTFSLPYSSIKAGGEGITAVDWDRDGDNDLIVVRPLNTSNLTQVLWVRNLGGGNWDTLTLDYNFDWRGHHSVVSADIDLDGDEDLVFTSVEDTSSKIYLHLFYNTGTPSSPLKTYHFVRWPGGLIATLDVGDLDCNGYPDIAFMQYGISNKVMFIGYNLDGTSFVFDTLVEPGLYGDYGVVIEDVDGDGYNDIVASVGDTLGRTFLFVYFSEDCSPLGSDDELSVSSPNTERPQRIFEIYDISGKLIYRGSEMPKLNKGIYFIKSGKYIHKRVMR